jgi:DNA-binding transcriptional LysR family regulator
MIACESVQTSSKSLVGAPSYFETRIKPETPHDLGRTTASHFAYRLWWLLVMAMRDERRELKVRPDARLAFNTINLALDTAVSGLGLAYLPEDVVSSHLANGQLVSVLADWSMRMSGYHMYYPSRRQQTPAFSLLVDVLRYRG